MANFNAIKFTFIVPKSHVKVILDISFDKDINILYPRLSTAPEDVKVKGVADIQAFQELTEEYEEKMLSGLDIIAFHQKLKFKFVEIKEISQPVPFAEKKEIIKDQQKKVADKLENTKK